MGRSARTGAYGCEYLVENATRSHGRLAHRDITKLERQQKDTYDTGHEQFDVGKSYDKETVDEDPEEVELDTSTAAHLMEL